ncbi:hypothetical protein E0494_05395 [Marinilabiliaceae bacterium JC040]|nr:hypothetical protein [Marinilabiliaceae bacterium JC040]
MLKNILAITGKPGLYKMVSNNKNAMIVESVSTGKRFPAYTSAQIVALDDIAIYTESEDMPLREVFKLIAEKTNFGPSINHKEKPELLKEYLKDILPEYDEDRVYPSDMKKLFQWYNILQENDLLKVEEEKTED